MPLEVMANGRALSIESSDDRNSVVPLLLGASDGGTVECLRVPFVALPSGVAPGALFNTSVSISSGAALGGSVVSGAPLVSTATLVPGAAVSDGNPVNPTILSFEVSGVQQSNGDLDATMTLDSVPGDVEFYWSTQAAPSQADFAAATGLVGNKYTKTLIAGLNELDDPLPDGMVETTPYYSHASADGGVTIHSVGPLTLDTTALVFGASNPLDDAINVAVGASLVRDFDDDVAGAGTITLRLVGGAAVEVFNLATGAGDNGGTISRSANVKTFDRVTITPGSDMAFSTAHAIRTANLIDTNSNPIAADITDDTTWNFTTAAAPSNALTRTVGVTSGSLNPSNSSNEVVVPTTGKIAGHTCVFAIGKVFSAQTVGVTGVQVDVGSVAGIERAATSATVSSGKAYLYSFAYTQAMIDAGSVTVTITGNGRFVAQQYDLDGAPTTWSASTDTPTSAQTGLPSPVSGDLAVLAGDVAFGVLAVRDTVDNNPNVAWTGLTQDAEVLGVETDRSAHFASQEISVSETRTIEAASDGGGTQWAFLSVLARL